MGARREDRLNADGLYGCANATIFTATVDNDTYYLQPGDNLVFVKPIEAIANIMLPSVADAAGQWYNIVHADPGNNFGLRIRNRERAGPVGGWNHSYTALPVTDGYRKTSLMYYCNGIDWWRINPYTGVFEGVNVPT